MRWHGAHAQSGFVELPEWTRIVEASDASDHVLRSRGINLESTGTGPKSGAASHPVAAHIVKTLQYNKLTLAEGFEEFDADVDGFISTQDLLDTAEVLRLVDNLNSTQLT